MQKCDCVSAEMREDGHLSRVMGEDEPVRAEQPINAGYTLHTHAWNACILCGDGQLQHFILHETWPSEKTLTTFFIAYVL